MTLGTYQQNGPVSDSSGRLIGIARRSDRYVSIETIASGLITTKAGRKGDHKGPKFVKRQITIMTIEDWHAALADLSQTSKPSLNLSWTVRLANLLILGRRLPRGRGAVLPVGHLELRAVSLLLTCGRITRHMTDCERRCIQTGAAVWRALHQIGERSSCKTKSLCCITRLRGQGDCLDHAPGPIDHMVD